VGVESLEDSIGREMGQCLGVAGGCVVEGILRDTHAVHGHPETWHNWVRIAREVTAARA